MQESSSAGLRQKLLRYLADTIRKQNELLREYVSRLRVILKDCTVVLFGSRARGTHLPHSDYDVCVILRKVSDNEKINLIEQLRRLKPPGLSLDLVVVSVDEVLNDRLVQDMLRNCVILYDGLSLREVLKTLCGCQNPEYHH